MVSLIFSNEEIRALITARITLKIVFHPDFKYMNFIEGSQRIPPIPRQGVIPSPLPCDSAFALPPVLMHETQIKRKLHVNW